MASRGSGGSLRNYLLVRLALVIPMVLILLTFVFVLMRVAPGDPVSAALGGKLTQAQIAAKQHALGLDQPLYQQYGEYLKNVFTGKFGETLNGEPVLDIVKHQGAHTLELTVAALIVAVIVGLGVGLVAGRMRDSAFDVGGRLFGVAIYAAPVFLTGLLAQLVFGKYLGWLPTSGIISPGTGAFMATPTNIPVLDAIIDGDSQALLDAIKHLVLPAVTLGLLLAGIFIRLVRVNVIQTLRGDYIEAARARGLGEPRVVVRHAFRNALVPVITVMGLQAALLLSGAILTEETFSWPGIGRALIRYLNERDYTAVQGIITVFALAVVLVSVVIDLVNVWVDPRVKYS
jgi:peptide/nickel transport system permease protein